MTTRTYDTGPATLSPHSRWVGCVTHGDRQVAWSSAETEAKLLIELGRLWGMIVARSGTPPPPEPSETPARA